MRRVSLTFLLLAGLLAGTAATTAAEMKLGYSTSATRKDLRDAPSPSTVARYADWGGADFARLGIHWEAVQPERNGDLRWRQYDEQVGALRDRGIRPLVLVADAPQWAADSRCNGRHCPPAPDHLDDWAYFVRLVARRYGDAAAIEVWNAPNTRGWWAIPSGPDPESYARVFNWAAGAAHRVDPAIPVLYGSLGYAGGTDASDGSHLSIPTFLRRFYSALDFRQLTARDGLAIHAYPSLSELDTFSGRFANTLRDARETRQIYDPGRALWITEVGMTTTGPFAVTQQQQKDVLLRAERALRAADDVAAASVFTLIESKWDPEHPEEKGFGIIERNAGELIPKRAFCAFAALAGTSPTLTGCPLVSPDDPHPSPGPGPTDPPPANLRCTVLGTPGPDVLVGTVEMDVICGKSGDDVLIGAGGNDLIRAGKGADRLVGGSASDRLLGGRGADTIIGGRGSDLIVGGPQGDLLRGRSGRDTLREGKGGGRLFGGEQADSLFGGPRNDLLVGGAGRDRLVDRQGSNTFRP